MTGEAQGRWDASSLNLGSLPPAPTDLHYQLHLAAVEFEMSSPILIETKDDIQSQKHWAEKIEPFEHQIRNLITFCRRAPVALIADDVGLGKTISAGLILNELQTRRRVRKVLILCPKVMLDQWKEELESKFGMARVAIGSGVQFTDHLREDWPVVVTTYESAGERIDKIHAAGFDMLILDEAHKLRNLHGTPKPPKLAIAVHEALKRRSFRYVLMLTATPVQNRLWDIYSLVDCLAVAKGHLNPLGSPESFKERFLAGKGGRRVYPERKDEFRRRVQDYVVRTSRGTAGLSFPERRLQSVICDPSHAELEMVQRVSDAVKVLGPLVGSSIAEAMFSSPRALVAQLRNMVAKGTVRAGLLPELERVCLAVGAGCKLDRVIRICREMQESNPLGWRVLIFTRRKETLALISDALISAGWSVGSIRGDDPAGNRHSIKAYRMEPPEVHVIVSTDAGAVGLNLQSGNVLINYDLPWNPMVLEQRIGRVQRLGSKFQHVIVWNMTVRGSVEEIIVARLLEKLHAVSDTLGDIESVLEASDYGDNDGFEKQVRDLVAQAMRGIDVNAALEKARRSIEAAKQAYAEEKQAVEDNIGTMDAMHQAGPKMPKLAPKAPRYDVPSFCKNAFSAEGGAVQDVGPGRLQVSMRGRATWVAVFDDSDAEFGRNAPMFGDGPVQLYQEGSRHFERLTGEWRRRHAHRVIDRLDESRRVAHEALLMWAEDLAVGAKVSEFKIVSERPWFHGEIVVRATAAVAHDRYEKLCTASITPPGHRELSPPASEHLGDEPVTASSLHEHVGNAIRSVVEGDANMREFVRFYDERRTEEMSRAGVGPGRLEVGRRFETNLAAECVGASGSRYLSLCIDADIIVGGENGRYSVKLELVPLSGQVLEQPVREVCQRTAASVPSEWLQCCSKSGMKVMRHFLIRSPISGGMALPEYFVKCAETERLLLPEDLGCSSITGLVVGSDLLRPSAVSGDLALERELVPCEVTGALVLPGERVRSGISGKWFRRDQLLESAISGLCGHATELTVCQESGETLVPEEGEVSNQSGMFVRKDLLRTSDKHPHRRALEREMVRCEVTGRLLLQDEATMSAVSGQPVGLDVCELSEATGRAAAPSAFVRCQVSGARLLPDEVERSVVSGMTVDRRLLVASAVSGQVALESELRTCEITGSRVLPSELVASAVSGKLVRQDQVVASAMSNRLAHGSELVICQATLKPVLPEEVEASSLSGKRVRRDLLIASDKNPSRKGLADELVRCVLSTKRLLRDEVVASTVSGRLVDADLCLRSKLSGRVALPEEFVTCEESMQQILPDESGICSATGLRVEAGLLGRSDVSSATVLSRLLLVCPESGDRGCETEFRRCQITGLLVSPRMLETCAATTKTVVTRLLVTCAISGTKLLRDKALRSEESGRLAHAEFGSRCAWTGRMLLSDEIRQCPLTKVPLSRTVALDWAPAPLMELVKPGVPTDIGTDATSSQLRQRLGQHGLKAKAVRWLRSPTHDVVAFVADCSGLFGMLKKHVMGFASDDPAAKNGLAMVVGRVQVDGGWKSDG